LAPDVNVVTWYVFGSNVGNKPGEISLYNYKL